jgi:hypothetical protein
MPYVEGLEDWFEEYIKIPDWEGNWFPVFSYHDKKIEEMVEEGNTYDQIEQWINKVRNGERWTLPEELDYERKPGNPSEAHELMESLKRFRNYVPDRVEVKRFWRDAFVLAEGDPKGALDRLMRAQRHPYYYSNVWQFTFWNNEKIMDRIADPELMSQIVNIDRDVFFGRKDWDPEKAYKEKTKEEWEKEFDQPSANAYGDIRF